MCTATWIHAGGGYELFVNRDESRERAPELPPRRFDGARRPFLAPVDGEAGGSWVSVNAAGLALVMTNRYGAQAGAEPRAWTSRGQLLLELADARDRREVEARVRELDLAPYRGFGLAALDRGGVSLLRWSRRELEVVPEAVALLPLVSSSHADAEGIERERRGQLATLVAERGQLGPDALLELHRSHLPARGAWSVCMHRETAGTRSSSWISVRREEVRLRHCAGPPCRGTYGAPLVLPSEPTP